MQLYHPDLLKKYAALAVARKQAVLVKMNRLVAGSIVLILVCAFFQFVLPLFNGPQVQFPGLVYGMALIAGVQGLVHRQALKQARAK